MQLPLQPSCIGANAGRGQFRSPVSWLRRDAAPPCTALGDPAGMQSQDRTGRLAGPPGAGDGTEAGLGPALEGNSNCRMVARRPARDRYGQHTFRPPDLAGLFLVVDEIRMSRKMVA